MIIAICWKFGTRGCGAAVGVEEGMEVGGVDVDVSVEGIGDGLTVGDGVDMQAARKTKRRRQTLKRFIIVSINYR